jgi:Domain of unknown function (DUF5606)
MEYGKIIAVTGMPGLYELISSKNDGAIVRSLDDKATKFVSSRIHNFSHLESIEVYTVRENVNLVDVLLAMEKSKEAQPSEKDSAATKAYFEKVFPDLDFERVYSSDLKKMVKWYAVLKQNNIEIKLSEPAEELEEDAVVVEEEVKEKPKKAAKKEEKKEEAPAKEPVKKAAKAKAADKEEEAPKKTKAAKPAAEKAAPTKKK